jgi:hypothetical protein
VEAQSDAPVQALKFEAPPGIPPDPSSYMQVMVPLSQINDDSQSPFVLHGPAKEEDAKAKFTATKEKTMIPKHPLKKFNLFFIVICFI